MIKNKFENRFQKCVIPARSEYMFPYKRKSHVVLCVNCVFREGAGTGGRCDEYIFFDYTDEADGVYLVERKDNKTKDIKVNHIHEQLQGGAKFITDFLKKDAAFDDDLLDFVPVLVAHTPARALRDRLKLQKVRLRGKTMRIRHTEVGKKLPLLENK